MIDNGKNLAALLRQAGVVGAGGAGFPTYVKASSRVSRVIANAAECEPLLRSNQELICRSAGEVIRGLRIMMLASGAEKATIGIKAKHKSALEALRNALDTDPENAAVDIHLLPDIYPAGDEHILVHEVTGLTIPPGGIPLQVGVVVNNVETLYNVSRAVDGRPVTEKLVTVTGAVGRPATVIAPVGTRLLDLLPLAGNPTVDDWAVIEGGPMMGRLAGPDAVVTRTTSGFIILPAGHSLIRGRQMSIETDLRRTRGMCCQCGHCTEICPRYLLGNGLRPHHTMTGVVYNVGHLYLRGSAWLCSECGLCEALACPMELSPRRVNAWLKQQMARQGIKPPADTLLRTHPQRPYRQVPTGRLVTRLGLRRYDVPAPLLPDPARPGMVKLLLKQHAGLPASPVVRPGDRVKAGQVVADVPEKALGVPIHASISGRLVRVEADAVIVESLGR